MKKINKFLFSIFSTLLASSILVCSCSQRTLSYDNSITGAEPAVENLYPESHNKTIYHVNKKLGLNALNSFGNQNILVIPVSFSDYSHISTEENRLKIVDSFFGESEKTSWESVSSYYYKSSNSKLKLSGLVTPWFDIGITSNELINYKSKDKQWSNTGENGTWWVTDQAINWYKSIASKDEIKKFDQDNDGKIDYLWLVYNVPSYGDMDYQSTFWAFTFWNVENLFENNYVPFLYSWASIDFIFDAYGNNGIDAHTYIHETGHGLGLSDYYDTTYSSYPFGCIDMMDYNICDHCAYTKYLLGWITPKETIYGSQNKTIKLKSTEKFGDFAIISNKKNDSPFAEYFIVEYITPTGLNEKDSRSKYKDNIKGYSKNGIRISHVDARGLGLDLRTGKQYITENYDEIYKIAFNNTPSYELGFYCNSTGLPYREITLMQKDYSTFDTSVLGSKFNPNKHDCLFYSGEEFKLGKNSKYNNLMPSKSSKLNSGDDFQIQIKVKSLREEAEIEIITL